MSGEIVSGLFALSGALLGGLISYATTRIDRKWDKAQRHIGELSEQVSAYYQLEQIYKEKVAEVDSSGRSAKTVMEDMRSKVTETGEFERPYMTTLAAQKIRREWL